MNNVLIFHGAYGYPQENWFVWLKDQLNLHNIICDIPHFPTPKNQSLNNWFEVIHKYYSQQITAQSVLIGHSLGAVFLLRLLEQIQIQVKMAILIGCFLGPVGFEQFDVINQDFFTEIFCWQSIIHHAKKFIVFHGQNDPYVSMHHFDILVKKLHARPILVDRAGHFNTASGYDRFPLLWQYLKVY